jgi:hypothetical protein
MTRLGKNMEELINRIRSADKKGLFGAKKLFKYGNIISEVELAGIESELGSKIPDKIRLLIIELGEGSINDLRIHGKDGIYAFDDECGEVEGFITFASDEMGNHYAYSPHSDDPNKIYYVCHDPAGYCVVADDAEEFFSGFVNRGFTITDYVVDLDLIEM